MHSPRQESIASSRADHQVTGHESELILAAQTGSHAAFEELQQTYSNRIYRSILSITRNCEDAEDALQDTFFRAYRALPSFEGRAKISSWLTRIAINSALMTVRKRHAPPGMSIEQNANCGDDSSRIDVPDSALNPEQLCYQNQRSQAISLAIRRLDPKLRTPIHMWLSDEPSMKELAQQLGVSIASAKARLHRARKRLIRSPELRNHKMNRDLKCLGNALAPDQSRLPNGNGSTERR